MECRGAGGADVKSGQPLTHSGITDRKAIERRYRWVQSVTSKAPSKERAVQKSYLWAEGAFDIHGPVTAAKTI